MTALRTLLCVVSATSALAFPLDALSQVAASGISSFSFANGWQTSARSALGLNVGASRAGGGCGTTALICDNPERTARLHANTMIGNHWGVEVGYLDMGRIAAAGGETGQDGGAGGQNGGAGGQDGGAGGQDGGVGGELLK